MVMMHDSSNSPNLPAMPVLKFDVRLFVSPHSLTSIRQQMQSMWSGDFQGTRAVVYPSAMIPAVEQEIHPTISHAVILMVILLNR